MVGRQRADPFHFKFKILKNRRHFTSELNGSNTINFSKRSGRRKVAQIPLWVELVRDSRGWGWKETGSSNYLVAFNSPFSRGFQNVPCSGPFHSPCFPCPFSHFSFPPYSQSPKSKHRRLALSLE